MKETNKNFIKELHQGLRRHRGSMNELAKKCDCSREWVRRVLKGDYEDVNVIANAAIILESRQSAANDKIQQAINLLNKSKKGQLVL